MYEESFGMPLLMKYPKSIQPGTVVTALTQKSGFRRNFFWIMQACLFRKICKEKSFRPVLENRVKNDDFRRALYYHYYDYPAFHMVKKMYGIRTFDYKLFHVYDDIDEWEFYDLNKDPKELNNQFQNPDYATIIETLKKTIASTAKRL